MNQPEATYLGTDIFRYTWKELGIEAVLSNIHHEKDGLKCKLTVNMTSVSKLIRQGAFNLSSTRTRTEWQRALSERVKEIESDAWYEVMEQICAMSERRWEEGDPLIKLADVDESDAEPFLLAPFIVQGGPSVIFADGASGKSMFALAAALSIATNIPVLGEGRYPKKRGPVVYLDWEWSAAEHKKRLVALCKGHDIPELPDNLYYRRESAPLVDSAVAIRRLLAEVGAVCVVVDSLGFARGGEPDSADLTLKVFAAINSWGVPALITDHTNKNGGNQQQSGFGSIYSKNSARTMWRLDTVHNEEGSNLMSGLVNTKANGKLYSPQAFQINIRTDDDYNLTSIKYQARKQDLFEKIAEILNSKEGKE